MRYKDISQVEADPSTTTRELRRLWKLTVYEGKPDAKKPKTREETAIAWNQVDATRKAPGPLALPPEELGFVTWPRPGEDVVYLIQNPTDGPLTDDPIYPSVGTVSDEEDWDF
jgi:hypothetical protein